MLNFLFGIFVGVIGLAVSQYGVRRYTEYVRKQEQAKFAAEQAARNARSEQARRRYAENPQVPLRSRARSVVRSAIYLEQKFRSECGYTISELIGMLECKFDPSMTFDNYGAVWEIDHVKPLKDFDLTDANQFALAIHPTNLRPLFHIENQSKGAK